MTSFMDCYQELVVRGGPPAQEAYRRWLERPGFQDVHDFVLNFEHRYLKEITCQEMSNARARSGHALGDVKHAEQLPEVENWTTPFAFEHLFHLYLEKQHAVPTWQEFSAWLKGEAAPMLVDPLLSDFGWNVADQARKRMLSRAFRWRIGKFYYSAMRELDLFVQLRREYGLPVRYHVLADVLLRADFWLNDDVVCVYFANPRYRDRDQGRKPQAEQFLGSATPPFRIRHVAIERQGYGKFWIPSSASVEYLARALR